MVVRSYEKNGIRITESKMTRLSIIARMGEGNGFSGDPYIKLGKEVIKPGNLTAG